MHELVIMGGRKWLVVEIEEINYLHLYNQGYVIMIYRGLRYLKIRNEKEKKKKRGEVVVSRTHHFLFEAKGAPLHYLPGERRIGEMISYFAGEVTRRYGYIVLC